MIYHEILVIFFANDLSLMYWRVPKGNEMYNKRIFVEIYFKHRNIYFKHRNFVELHNCTKYLECRLQTAEERDRENEGEQMLHME